MSWTDEEIDNLFQESATAQSFEYNNAYFSEVEAMLPVNKKGKDFLWMGTALLFIVALTTGYFVTNSNENTLNSYNNQLASTQLKKEKSNEIKNGAADNSTRSTLNTTKNSIDNSSETLNNTTLTNAQTASTNSENSEFKLKSEAVAASDIVKKSLAVNNTQSELDKNRQRTLADRNSATNSSSNGVSGLSTIGLNQGLTSLELEALNGQVNNTASAADNQRVTSETQYIDVAGLSTKSANEIDQNLDRSLIPNALSMPPLSQLRPKAAFYVELNGGISQSLIASSSATSTSFGGGFGIESHLGNFNLTTGLNFKLSNFNDLSYSGSGFQYGYGSVFRAGSVNYEKMYSIEMPISIGYNFGKHNLNIGVRPSILIGSKYQETSFQNNLLVRADENYGFTDDLKRIGVKPTIGYSYHSNQWTIGGNIGVQMMQSVHGEEMNLTNKRLPIDGQVYLRRTIRLR